MTIINVFMGSFQVRQIVYFAPFIFFYTALLLARLVTFAKVKSLHDRFYQN